MIAMGPTQVKCTEDSYISVAPFCSLSEALILSNGPILRFSIMISWNCPQVHYKRWLDSLGFINTIVEKCPKRKTQEQSHIWYLWYSKLQVSPQKDSTLVFEVTQVNMALLVLSPVNTCVNEQYKTNVIGLSDPRSCLLEVQTKHLQKEKN